MSERSEGDRTAAESLRMVSDMSSGLEYARGGSNQERVEARAGSSDVTLTTSIQFGLVIKMNYWDSGSRSPCIVLLFEFLGSLTTHWSATLPQCSIGLSVGSGEAASNNALRSMWEQWPESKQSCSGSRVQMDAAMVAVPVSNHLLRTSLFQWPYPGFK